MEKLQEAFKNVEDNNIETAYDTFTKLINDKTCGIDARYARAMIDISKLKAHTEDTINDLLYLSNTKNKYKDIAYSFLTFLYDDLGNSENVIKYGTIALKKETPFVAEINFALARNYLRYKNMSSYKLALIAIEKSLAYENSEEYIDFLACEAEILILMNEFDKVDEKIDRIIKDYSHGALTYFLKARLAFAKYQTLKDETFLEDVIRYGKVCLEYEDNYMAKIMLIESYTKLKDVDSAITIIESLKTDFNKEEVLLEKIKVYDEVKEYDKALELITNGLKENYSWRLLYMKGAILYDKDAKNGKQSIENFKKAYKESLETDILVDIIKLNRRLDDDKDTFLFLEEIVNNSKDKGYIYFNMADIAIKESMDYEKIIEYYKLSYENGFLTKTEFNNAICNYTKEPNSLNKEIKRLEKENLKTKDPFSFRKTAIRYIYKEDGYKQNLNKAYKLLLKCKNDFDDSCTNSLIARSLELNGKLNLALNYYERGYNIIKNEYVDCPCSYGYYAHALFNGIGQDKDIEKAKEVILESLIVEPTFTCSHIVYYYAYFYLDGDNRFKEDIAIKLLESNYPYYRYDISRIVILSQVIKKANRTSEKLDELLKTLDKFPKEDLKYYNENINKEKSLPFWRNV